jgi:predicted GIY-YIG superfamily endonuclease
MTTIYILKLEHECYYVGKTNNYSKSKKINDHLTNNGALWTQLHKVIGKEKIIPNCSSLYMFN